MDTDQTIRTFTDFFRDRGHRTVGGVSLVPPPGDPVLFTTSGMHPLTRYLSGRDHPLGRRLVGVQRCLRTTDLDEVGDRSHLTVFEMLGSWSLGAYPLGQSLRWGYELLRDGFGIDTDRMRVTVFGGDGQVGPDTGSLSVWQDLGVAVELTREENWWSNGPTGPCGPDSEIFVWTGEEWVEVWNHVGMRYHRHEDGHLEPLPRSNVDTGMGLERLLAIIQGKRDVFDIDLFEPWVGTVDRLWPGLDRPTLRLVCDHLRSSVVVVGDGVRPSNTGRGYVLRRLVRRLLTTLWRQDGSRTLPDLPPGPVQGTLEHFGQRYHVEAVLGVLVDEERRFRSLLDRGRRQVSRLRGRGPLTDEDYRWLHETHGLPRDLVQTLLAGSGRPPG